MTQELISKQMQNIATERLVLGFVFMMLVKILKIVMRFIFRSDYGLVNKNKMNQ
ncbi:MAG: hypothetical protein LBE11_07975 [Prevotellaceae bacterium]|nr:hypothetical protein [Prevotellaceae bacterium]